jgi:hypothetical protein
MPRHNLANYLIQITIEITLLQVLHDILVSQILLIITYKDENNTYKDENNKDKFQNTLCPFKCKCSVNW